MSRSSLARYRRSQQPQEPTLRLITFQLRQHWFCLPLAMARRVIAGPPDSQAPIAGLTQLQQDNVPLVDLAALIFQETPLLPGEAAANPSPPFKPPTSRAILVVDSPHLGPIGILIDGTPAIKRVKQSAFSPVPAVYLIMNRLQGINTLVTLGADEPPLFLLEIDTLLARAMQP